MKLKRMGALVKVTMMASLDPQHHAIGNNANNTSCASLTEVYLAKDCWSGGLSRCLCGGARACSRRTAGRGAQCASTFAVSMLQKENYITKQHRDVTVVSRCVLELETAMLWPVAKARVSD